MHGIPYRLISHGVHNIHNTDNTSSRRQNHMRNRNKTESKGRLIFYKFVITSMAWHQVQCLKETPNPRLSVRGHDSILHLSLQRQQVVDVIGIHIIIMSYTHCTSDVGCSRKGGTSCSTDSTYHERCSNEKFNTFLIQGRI